MHCNESTRHFHFHSNMPNWLDGWVHRSQVNWQKRMGLVNRIFSKKNYMEQQLQRMENAANINSILFKIKISDMQFFIQFVFLSLSLSVRLFLYRINENTTWITFYLIHLWIISLHFACGANQQCTVNLKSNCNLIIK